MEQFAKSFMQCKSFKDRLQNVNESLDHLSSQYSNLYIMLFKEMKKRELEYNDSFKIIQWLDTKKSNSYFKLHEALILVKSHNMIAKDNYILNLRHLLQQTIENGSDIEAAVKICNLIEKSSHLSTIYESLKHLIQKVKQMKYNKHKSQLENVPGHFEPTLITYFKQLKIQNALKASDRSTMMQSTSSNSAHCLPHFSLNSFGYDHFEMIATANRVNETEYNQHNSNSRNIKWNGNFKSSSTNHFEQFKINWPSRILSSSSKLAYGLPHFNLNCSGYDHLEIIATANGPPDFKFSQDHINLTILNQGMERVFIRWLCYVKLHKYQWFFSGLSYLEIECIDEDNIEGFISKVNIKSIAKGVQKKICLSVKALRDRQQKFKDLIMYLDLEVTLIELCEYMTYMWDILHYPIPNKNCVVGDQLQQDIVFIMEKSLNQVLEKLVATRSFVAQSLLGTTINTFLECALLILENQTFLRQQIDKITMLAETLKYKVNQVSRNLY